MAIENEYRQKGEEQAEPKPERSKAKTKAKEPSGEGVKKQLSGLTQRFDKKRTKTIIGIGLVLCALLFYLRFLIFLPGLPIKTVFLKNHCLPFFLKMTLNLLPIG
jgi:hypothetical protein